MLKQISKFEHYVGDKVFHFLCDSDSPVQSVKEALFQFLKYIGQIEDNLKAQQEAEAAKEVPPTPPNSPVESKVEPINHEEQK